MTPRLRKKNWVFRTLAGVGLCVLFASVPVGAGETTVLRPILAIEEIATPAPPPIVVESAQEEKTSGKVAQVFQSATSPFKRAYSWASSLINKSKSSATPAVEPRPALQLKIRSIQYLADSEEHSYPAVVDSLLTSLDDSSEELRYAALSAIQEKCVKYQCDYPANELQFVKSRMCECTGCRADRRVVQWLTGMLLDRQANGTLKEQSTRIRDLAIDTISTCLNRGKKPSIRSANATVTSVPALQSTTE